MKPKSRKDIKKAVLSYSGSANHWLVYDTLIEMAEVEGTDDLICSQEALAATLHTSRQTISRSLKVLEEIGAINTGNKNTYIKIVIK